MAPNGQSPRPGGLWRLFLGVLVFALFAPVGLIVAPLALLLLLDGTRDSRTRIAGAFASVLAALWLFQAGGLPDQTVKAAGLIAAVVFVGFTVLGNATTIHRGLAAAGAALLGVSAGFVVLGRTWGELSWSVEHQIGFATRQIAGRMWTTPDGGPLPETTAAMLRDSQVILERMAAFAAEYFSALLAIEILIGLTLAYALYRRVSVAPAGRPPDAFRDFTFSEHLGWIPVLGIVMLLIPKLAFLKTAAGNAVLLGAAIYALRGAAVFSFVLASTGTSVLLLVLVGLAVVTMLPLMAAGAIVLGVLDTGLNIRKRWANMPARG